MSALQKIQYSQELSASKSMQLLVTSRITIIILHALSGCTTSNVQGTPQKSAALALPLPLAALEASLASSTMPTKLLNHQ
jgi:hypothetical protein